MAMLIIERGPGAGIRIPLNLFPVRLGRDPTNDVVIADDECSRFHLRLKQRGRLIIVEDLESRNGTFINGDRIINAVLKNGDRILLGGTELSFVTSAPEVQFATEIVHFDMVVAEELGLSGPINVDPSRSTFGTFKPQRLGDFNLEQSKLDPRMVKTIFDIHGDVLVVHDFEDAARTLIKSLHSLFPPLARAAFFVFSRPQRQLIPVAAKQYKKKQSFLLSQRAFEGVITRKQGLILQADSQQVTQTGRNRAILPMIQNDDTMCILHLETDQVPEAFTPENLQVVQALLLKVAPCFETMLLRRELDTWLAGTVETLIAAIEAKDTYTRGHSERVSKYSMAIADELKLNRETKKLLMISSICHDIGKVGIPDSILKKASLLSAEEYEEMKLHPSIGADIMTHLPSAKRFLSGVKHHHEKWDGTGYPDGLTGEEIPFFGRIVGVADVYDAMVSGRVYSGFLDQGDAAEKLAKEKDLFDPEILKAFTRAYNNGTLTLKTDTMNQINAAPEETAINVPLRAFDDDQPQGNKKPEQGKGAGNSKRKH